MIKLLTPSPDYTDEHNAWLRRAAADHPPAGLHRSSATTGRSGATTGSATSRVDRINGYLGHELKFDGQRLVGQLPAGRASSRTARLAHLQAAPRLPPRREGAGGGRHHRLGGAPGASGWPARPRSPATRASSWCRTARPCSSSAPTTPSTAASTSRPRPTSPAPGTFLSNFEPLDREQAQAHGRPRRRVRPLHRADEAAPGRLPASAPAAGYVVSSAHPRLVDGKPSKNPRYLQQRPDLVAPARRLPGRDRRAAGPPHPGRRARSLSRSTRCWPGRRNNPPEPEIGVPPLAVYNPIHYQELPELFMDFICSLTGKSPSTTGFGSEGALTKGPFNALLAGRRPEQRAGLGHPHRLRRLHHRRRLRRAALPGGSRHQHAGAGGLVPHAAVASATRAC